MKIIKITAAFLCLTALAACEGYEMFEEELYEKIVYVLTKEDNQVFSEVHSLDEDVSKGNVIVMVSGSLQVTEPVTVEFESDPKALDEYNEKMFGVEEDKYLKPLASSFYEIPSMKVTVDPTDIPARAYLPIHVMPEGLSPDSTYFIPLKIKSASIDSISEEHSNVMYRVFIKNKYADQQEQTLYSMRGEKTESGKVPYTIMTNKVILPISKNKIRTTIEQKAFEAKMDVINSSCMVIEINADNSLTITPFNSDFVDIEMVSQEGYNQYRQDSAGNYRFYLSYRYRTRSSADADFGEWVGITENLLRYVEILDI
ncbi:BT_3044 domain-containing protein [Parabacteroides sp. AM08-6]|uniref:BT_3044 domain-containing protein n=1 Tax=Parabacteroides sp. AM08-6 TaxID=2292053 RepID=UPI000EFF64E5|nr:DUF4361 domain-containing protein [Parabacteroides sp. AM08-6]RHJ82329.1 DUF4361 domain-containing protein [Parabacteroides sp. AM08-6]